MDGRNDSTLPFRWYISETDQFIRRAKGLARASAPSLRSLKGISVRPVDFLVFKVFYQLCADKILGDGCQSEGCVWW